MIGHQNRREDSHKLEKLYISSAVTVNWEYFSFIVLEKTLFRSKAHRFYLK